MANVIDEVFASGIKAINAAEQEVRDFAAKMSSNLSAGDLLFFQQKISTLQTLTNLTSGMMKSYNETYQRIVQNATS